MVKLQLTTMLPGRICPGCSKRRDVKWANALNCEVYCDDCANRIEGPGEDRISLTESQKVALGTAAALLWDHGHKGAARNLRHQFQLDGLDHMEPELCCLCETELRAMQGGTKRCINDKCPLYVRDFSEEARKALWERIHGTQRKEEAK